MTADAQHVEEFQRDVDHVMELRPDIDHLQREALEDDVQREVLERLHDIVPQHVVQLHPDIDDLQREALEQQVVDVDHVRELDPEVQAHVHLEAREVRPFAARPRAVHLDLETVHENHVSTHPCLYCGATLFGEEKSLLCCSNGRKVLSEHDRVLPEVFVPLYEKYADVLRTRSREVNQLCSMTAVGVNTITGPLSGVTIKYESRSAEISGRVFHFHRDPDPLTIGHPLLGSARSYLYAESASAETPTSDRFTQEVVDAALEFRRHIREHNTFIRETQLRYGVTEDLSFMNVVERLSVHFQEGQGMESKVPQFVMLYSVDGNPFRKTESFSGLLNRDASIIKAWSPKQKDYERSTYVLLDPCGRSGWWESFDHENGQERFTDAAGNEMTFYQYLKMKTMQCGFLQRVPRLFEEWVLDGISRLYELRQDALVHVMNQQVRVVRPIQMFPATGHHLRRATAREIRQWNPEDGEKKSYGKLWRIPASVRGSPRYCAESVAKGMAQVYAMGGPHVFLTFTGNPKWEEIQSNLQYGNAWWNDPVLVCRIFKQKLETLLQGIRDGKYFGGRKSTYLQYVIEFQKRGMPHAHMLIRLENFESNSPEDVDEICSCAIPQDCESSCRQCAKCRLRDIVMQNMIHSCYAWRCYKTKAQKNDKTCSYRFPKPAVESTHLGLSGYWELKRAVGEEFMVAYNPQLSLEFSAHINVEIACGTKSVYYLRKYFSKRPDMVAACLSKTDTLKEQLDTFYRSRCLTSFEAVWETLGFAFQKFEPDVSAIQLYLPGEQPLVFDPINPARARERAEALLSDLDLYLKRPTDSEFDSVKLIEYFENYSFGVGRNGIEDQCIPPHRVVPKREQKICFVSNLNYSNLEQFALYLLLQKIPCRSLSELLAGELTFAKAAAKRGLTTDDPTGLQRIVLKDMINRHVPAADIVTYIASLAIYEVCDMAQLFDEFYPSMTESYHAVIFDAKCDAMRELSAILNNEGVSIRSIFAASDSLLEVVKAAEGTTAMQAQRYFTQIRIATQVPPVPNVQQRQCFQAVLDGNHRLLYINGSAGCGKTTVLNMCHASLQAAGKKVLCSAFTGVASGLLPGGLTCHRVFGLPVEDAGTQDDVSSHVSSISTQSYAAELLRCADVIIIDEVSMLHRQYLDVINSVLQDVMASHESFGGKRIVMAGDFQQLPPVVKAPPAESRSATVQASIASSSLFDSFVTLTMNENCRFVSQSYATYLSHVGLGKFPETDAIAGTQKVPLFPGVRFHTTLDECAAEFTSEIEQLQPRILISTTHDAANSFNEKQLDRHRVPGVIREYEAHHTIIQNGVGNNKLRLCAQDAEHFRRPGIPDYKLELFVGMPVMLIRNLFPSKGYANGTVLTVAALDHHTVTVVSSSGLWSAKPILLPRIKFSFIQGSVKIVRSQFPLVPAFATTINKVQGQTLPGGIVDVRRAPFCHGQLYVGLSRFVDETKMVLLVDESESLTSVVFPELLKRARLL
jgi:hypothetical protein